MLDVDILTNDFELEYSSSCFFLHQALTESSESSDFVSLFEKAVISALRCALLLRQKRNESGTTTSAKQITEAEEKYHHDIIDTFSSLTFSSEPLKQQLSIRFLNDLVNVDLYWLPVLIPCISSLLLSSNLYTVHCGLKYGFRPVLRALFNFLGSKKNNLNHYDTIKVALRYSTSNSPPLSTILLDSILLGFSETFKLLLGRSYPLPSDDSSELIEGVSYSPRVSVLTGGPPRMRFVVFKVAIESVIYMIHSVGLLNDSDVHRHSNLKYTEDFIISLNKLMQDGIILLIDLLLHPVFPKSFIPTVIVLEGVSSLFMSPKLRPVLFPYILPVLSMITIATSPIRKCPHNRNEYITTDQEGIITTLPLEPISQLLYNAYLTLSSTLFKKIIIPKMFCCKSLRGLLRSVLLVQYLKILGTAPENDSILEVIIAEFISLLSYGTNPHVVQNKDILQSYNTVSIGTIKSRAIDLNSAGVFNESLLSKLFDFNFKLSTDVEELFNLNRIKDRNHSELNSMYPTEDIILKRDTDGLRYTLNKQEKRLDAVSWLTSMKSHDEAIHIIMRNFATHQFPEIKKDLLNTTMDEKTTPPTFFNTEKLNITINNEKKIISNNNTDTTTNLWTIPAICVSDIPHDTEDNHTPQQSGLKNMNHDILEDWGQYKQHDPAFLTEIVGKHIKDIVETFARSQNDIYTDTTDQIMSLDHTDISNQAELTCLNSKNETSQMSIEINNKNENSLKIASTVDSIDRVITSESEEDTQCEELSVENTRTILGCPSLGGNLVQPTSIHYITRHASSLQAIYLFEILDIQLYKADYNELTPINDEDTPSENVDPLLFLKHETRLFNNLKQQMALRLLLRASYLTIEAQRSAVSKMCSIIWDVPIKDKPLVRSHTTVWDTQLSATLDILFSKYSYELQHIDSTTTLSIATEESLKHMSPFYISLINLLDDSSSMSVGLFGFNHIITDLPDNEATLTKKDYNTIQLIEHTADSQHTTDITQNVALNESCDSNKKLSSFEENDSHVLQTDKSHHLLRYTDFFSISLQYVLGINSINLDNVCVTSLFGNRSKLHPEFSRWIVRFFTELPYIPKIGFSILWKLLTSELNERKIAYAVLGILLKASKKDSVNKRTAYAMLMHLCFDTRLSIRQESLSFLNRKILYNPLALGEIPSSINPLLDLPVSSKIQENTTPDTLSSTGTEWNNTAAVGTWIESLACTVLRLIIELYIPSTSNDVQRFNYPLKTPPFISTLAKNIADRLKATSVAATASALEISYLQIQTSCTLLSVCCSQRPGLLAALVDAYEVTATYEVSCNLAKALENQFIDTLQWIPLNHLTSLLLLLQQGTLRGLPLHLRLLETTVTAASHSGVNNDGLNQGTISPAIIIAEALRLFSRHQSLDVLATVISCFKPEDAVVYITRIVASGEKHVIIKTFNALLTIPNLTITSSERTVWKGEDLLSFLFQFAQTGKEQEVVPFRRIVECLDICFFLAKGENGKQPVLAPYVFIVFLNQLLDNFINFDSRMSTPSIGRSLTTPSPRLPKLFGRLLLLTVIHLPSLSSVIVSQVLPTLLNDSAQMSENRRMSGQCPIWEDSIAWKGLSATFLRLWAEKSDLSMKSQLQKLLCELPRTAFESLFQDLQRAYPSARNELVEFLFGEGAGLGERGATAAPHVLSLLGIH